MKQTVFESLSFQKSKRWILLILIICISIGLELYGRQCGFLQTPDSVQYVSTAKSFQTQNQFLNTNGAPITYWPPLFSLLLSLTDSPYFFLGCLNICCKVIIGIVLYMLASCYIKSLLGKVVFLIASLLNVSLIMISVFLWSELIFLTLVIVNFYLAINQNKKYYFSALILTGFLLCLQRNAGLFYTSGLCLGLLVNDPTLKNTRRLVIYFLLSTSGLWGWNIYATYWSAADFSFYDHNFFGGFWSNLVLFMKAIGKYAVPVQSTPVLLLVTLLLTGLVAFGIDKKRGILVSIMLVYLTCFSVLGHLSVDDIDRYLSVIMPFVFLLVVATVETVKTDTNRWLKYGLVMLTVFWLSHTLVRSAINVYSWHNRSCQTESSI